jgi:hypothetical protein
MLRALFAPLLLFLSSCSIVGATIISNTETVKDEETNKHIGSIRVSYDASFASCSTVLMIGVATAMTIFDYNKLSEATATGQKIVVIISDHNEQSLIKTSPAKYASLVNAIHQHLTDLVPICAEEKDEIGILIGGHSGSGEAAVIALQEHLFDFAPLGFVGLDPYELSRKTVDISKPLLLPAMYWGFSETTCLVTKEKAARAGYELTEINSRVLYVIHNGNGCGITHCVFTDRGCKSVCPTKDNLSWIIDLVAKSLVLFVDAIRRSEGFRKENFVLPGIPGHEVLLFVNHDTVQSSESIVSGYRYRENLLKATD